MSQDQNDITVFLLPFDMDNYGAEIQLQCTA